MHWTELPIHVIDFEGNRDSGIVEYGVVTLEGGEIISTRTRLCQAQCEIRPEEVRLHGIRSWDTEGKAPFVEEWNFFKGLRKTGPLAAHCATIENNLVKSVWPYPPYSPDFLTPGQQIPQWGPWIDTCILYTAFFPHLESHRLKDLIAAFDLQKKLDIMAAEHCPKSRSRYHAALYDALATATLLLQFALLLSFDGITIEWLLAYSAPRRSQREAFIQGDLFEGS